MEPRDRDQFDDLLDGAVKQYGNVEPRPGLEGRVLATLAANAGRTSAHSVWVWALGGAAAMLVVIGMWIGTGHRRPATPVAVVRPNVAEAPAQKTTVVIPPLELKKPAVRRVRSRQIGATAIEAAEPRLEQFPSRRPLGDEESMLVQYVQRYPQEATLIAQRQDEFEKRARQAEREIEKSSSSDQQER